jgi:hypothetical protein
MFCKAIKSSAGGKGMQHRLYPEKSSWEFESDENLDHESWLLSLQFLQKALPKQHVGDNKALSADPSAKEKLE